MTRSDTHAHVHAAARLLMGLACFGIASCGDSSDRERPNLILISLDTTRADRLSCYGYDKPTTPHLDAFADESVLFEDCSAQSTSTAPSHMSILTGHHVRRHGLMNNGAISFPPRTLASILTDEGWNTAAFVGHGSLQERWGHGVGFETFESWKSAEMRAKSFFSRNLPDVLPDALDWLDENQEEPFFLFVHGYDPHCPFVASEPYRSEFAGWYEGGFDLAGKCGFQAFEPLFEGDEPHTDDLRYLNDMYDAELREADDTLAGFFDELRQRGLLENSLVVFTSDHGEVLGEQEWVGHTRTWEPEIHVPLIVRFPGGAFAGRHAESVMHLDILPTVLSYLDVPIPEGSQGVDLMPLVRGEMTPDRRREIDSRMRLSQVSDLKTVVFDGRWKIVFGEDKKDIFPDGALFDLEIDPGEKNNLVFEKPERFENLHRRYLRWERLSGPEDDGYRGFVPTPEEDPGDAEQVRQMMQALGYAGDGEDY